MTAVNTGTNTITFSANVPATWQVGDTITIASLTAGSGFTFADIEIVSGPIGKAGMLLSLYVNTATAGDFIGIHPTETYAASKFFAFPASTAGAYKQMAAVPIINNVFSITWTMAGNGGLTWSEMGYM